MGRVWIVAGGLLGAGAVAMAALTAHGLQGRLEPAAIAQVQGAVQMQGWHALALLALGVLAPRAGWAGQGAGMAFVLGSVLFCGAVYAFALAGMRLPGVAPAGGMLLIAGWLLVAVAGITAR